MTYTIDKIKRSNLDQNALSQFLKRKRLELGLRLEDLCSGVCSCSYLSRIENSAVDVSSNYYQALFEKMNINYEELKKERSRNLYHEILQAYFRQDLDQIETIVQHALTCNNYVEVEIELMLLFYNVVTSKFDEARDIIIKLDGIYENFSNTELIFYLYSFAFYAYVTHQNKKAYKQLLVLTAIQYEDNLFECAIYDLAVKVMYEVGQINLCLKFYYHLKNIALLPLISTSLCINKLMICTIDSDIDYDTCLKEFNETAKFLDLNNAINKETYYYTLSKIYLQNGKYNEVYNLLIDNLYSGRITSIIISAAFHLHDMEINNKITTQISNYQFNKYEKIYYEYACYMLMIFKGATEYTLYNYLRNILIVDTVFYDDELHKQIELQFIERSIGCSKYKEGLKYLYYKKQETKHTMLT